jgi:hypothetical protein
LQILEGGVYKLLPNFRDTLLQVVGLNLLEIAQGRAGNNYLHSVRVKNFFRLGQRYRIAFPNVSQSPGYSLDESQIFRSFLVIVESLHDSHPSASAGEQNGSVSVVHPTYHFARVNLEIG